MSVTEQVACWPGVVCGTVVFPVMLVLLTDTLQLTLCSVLVPPLVKLSVNWGGGLAGSVFVEPV